MTATDQKLRQLVHAVHRTDRHASVNVITASMDDHDEEKRTDQSDQNVFVRSGKSETEVTIEDCARRVVGLLLKLTDRHL